MKDEGETLITSKFNFVAILFIFFKLCKANQSAYIRPNRFKARYLKNCAFK